MKSCERCESLIPEDRIRRQAKFCCNQCRDDEVRDKRAASQSRGTSRNNTGAASELAVAQDLLLRGYSVFRSVSPNAEFDLVAAKDGDLFRIEVKTARRYHTGVLYYPQPRNNCYDVLATYEPDENVVTYLTSLESF